MDVRYLNYILTIAKKKNMTRASEELYVSQSSLSQFLAKLEDELGTKLFFRTKGEFALTPAGLLYIQAAEQMIEIKKKVYQDIKNLNNKGHIAVGVASQFGLQILSEIIPKFKSTFANVTVEIRETDVPNLIKLILEETVDLGVMTLANLSVFPNQCDILRNEEIYFAIPKSHPYYEINKNTPIPTKDFVQLFKDDNFLRFRKGFSLRAMTDKLFAEFDFTPNTMFESNSIVMIRNMVSKGIGVAFIPESCIVDTTNIACYHLSPKLYRYDVLVRRKNWLSNKPEREFCSYIKNYFPKEEKPEY
ncbi:MAG: LysR family transcriptional regulator [Fusobacteriaceae bacterium]|jgi:DNA-binding transcriptional LysR family regulator|nr:LysR family transcriptional regulator [Fusobacteriaceae bacterium]